MPQQIEELTFLKMPFSIDIINSLKHIECCFNVKYIPFYSKSNLDSNLSVLNLDI